MKVDEKVVLDPTKSDPLVDIARRAGFTMKEPNTSIAIFQREQANTFRVMCFECFTQYDVFGLLKPADSNGDGECTVVHRILEHFGNCALKRRPKNTFIIQNKNSPNLFKITVTWMEERPASVVTAR